MSKPLAPDTRVFFRHPEKSWIKGVVAEWEETAKGLRYGVKDENNDIHENLPEFDVHKMLDGIEHAKPDDLLQLSELHVSVLLSVLRNRFNEDNIYTNIGSLIIAVNPFKFTIPWYYREVGLLYIKEGWKGAPLSRTTLRPHSWAVANKSYWDMMYHGNQSILISGESGAGKTEGAKIILKYLGDLCGALLQQDGGAKEDIDEVGAINDRLNKASPILEAFGNAKTTRNDNSSRFGKFMKIQFNEKGVLVGMHVTPYLLEKSRVVKCGQGERLYHSFYQLVCGASPEMREKYQLKQPKDYEHLAMGGQMSIPKVDDSADFEEVLAAMKTVGFTDDEQDASWRVVAVCLHLAGVEFGENEHAKATVAGGADGVERAAAVMQIDAASLQKSLLTKTRQMGKEKTTMPLTKRQAMETRNSLCIFLYEQLFLWMVQRINDVTSKPQEEARWIGLLDIFGFENFEVNSFEQLCINLANERLQKHYNMYVYDRDTAECRAEGIKNAQAGVKVQDNQGCLDLIMGNRDSIFSKLDDICKTTQSGDEKDDQKFLVALGEAFGEGDKADKGQKRTAEGQLIQVRENPEHFFEYDERRPKLFAIHHYAGKVCYEKSGFVSKNMDLLSEEIKSVCRATKLDVLRALIPPPPPENARASRKTSVSADFKKSLNDLLDTIQGTTPNWVRCIRSTPLKRPGHFDMPSVLDQLTCSGVVETVKIRQQGFCYRIPFEEFFSRYSVLGEKSISSVKERCRSVLVNLKVDKDEGQIGSTKVFLRVKAFQLIEEKREDKLRVHVTVMQSVIRWRTSCVAVLDKKWAVMGRRIQKWARMVQCRDAIIVEHYKQVLGKMLALHRQQRDDYYKRELETRMPINKEELLARQELKADHKKGVKPLWAAVIVKLQKVEAHVREGTLEVEEANEFALFAPLERVSHQDAKQRRHDRRKRERHIAREERAAVEHKEEVARAGHEQDQEDRRAAIHRQWVPVRERLRKLEAKIARLNERRHRKIRQYQMQIDHELKRAKKDSAVAEVEEGALWSSFQLSFSSSNTSAALSSDHHHLLPRTSSARLAYASDSATTSDADEDGGSGSGGTDAYLDAYCARVGLPAVSASARQHRGAEAQYQPTQPPPPPERSGTGISDYYRELLNLGEPAAEATPVPAYPTVASAAVPASVAPAPAAPAYLTQQRSTSAASYESLMPSEATADYYRALLHVPRHQAHHDEAVVAAQAAPSASPAAAYPPPATYVDPYTRRLVPASTPPPPPPPQAPPPAAHRHVAPRAAQLFGDDVAEAENLARQLGGYVPAGVPAAVAPRAPANDESGGFGRHGSGFFSEAQVSALTLLGEAEDQEKRFYRAGVPSRLITDGNPAFDGVESYEEYTSAWRQQFAEEQLSRQQHAAFASRVKEHKQSKKLRRRVDSYTV